MKIKSSFPIKGIAVLFFISAIVACRNNNKAESENKKDTTQNLCFRNEYKFPDSTENIDVLELNLQINDGKVTGHYNWLPALKDQRKGTLDGSINGEIIKATYNYMQEGMEASVPITITLEKDRAFIKGDDITSGLDTEVTKISCENQ